jgi:antitoxin component of MazEF toxin-antitoxin module
LAVRIPADLAEACALSEGTELEVRNEGGVLVLVPDRARRKRYPLSRLVAGITSRNRPDLIDWGLPRGREAS